MSDEHEVFTSILDWFAEIEGWIPGAHSMVGEILLGPIPLASANSAYDLADQWRLLAEALGQAYEDVARAADPILAGWSGDGAAARFVEEWFAYLDGLRATVAGAAQMQQGVQNFGLEIELMKFMAALNLFLLAFSLVAVIAAIVPTAGGSLGTVPALFAACRVALGQAAAKTVGRIATIGVETAMRGMTRLFAELPAAVVGRALPHAARAALPQAGRALLPQAGRVLLPPAARAAAGRVTVAVGNTAMAGVARRIAARGISRTVANRLAAQALRGLAGQQLRTQLAGQTARAVQRQLARDIERRLLARAGVRTAVAGTGSAIGRTGAAQVAGVSLGREFTRYVGVRVAFGAGFMGGGNLLGQFGQVASGNRTDLDWDQVRHGVVQGAVFGAGMFGGPIGHTVGGATAGGGLALGQELHDYWTSDDPARRAIDWGAVGHATVQGGAAGAIFGTQTRLEHAALAGELRFGRGEVHALPGADAVRLDATATREPLVLTGDGWTPDRAAAEPSAAGPSAGSPAAGRAEAGAAVTAPAAVPAAAPAGARADVPALRAETPRTDTATAPRPTDARPADARPADARPADARPADARPADARPADARPADGASRAGGVRPADPVVRPGTDGPPPGSRVDTAPTGRTDTAGPDRPAPPDGTASREATRPAPPVGDPAAPPAAGRPDGGPPPDAPPPAPAHPDAATTAPARPVGDGAAPARPVGDGAAPVRPVEDGAAPVRPVDAAQPSTRPGDAHLPGDAPRSGEAPRAVPDGGRTAEHPPPAGRASVDPPRDPTTPGTPVPGGRGGDPATASAPTVDAAGRTAEAAAQARTGGDARTGGEALAGEAAAGDAGGGARADAVTGASVRPRDEMAAFDWADAAYDRFRADDADVAAIAAHLADAPRADGPPGFTAAEVAQVKHHLMTETHPIRDYDGTLEQRRFDADPDIAEAWIRLRDGRPLPEDLVLLEHELAESGFLRAHPDADYRAAHEFANRRHNWQDIRPGRTGEDLDVRWERSGDPTRPPEDPRGRTTGGASPPPPEPPAAGRGDGAGVVPLRLVDVAGPVPRDPVAAPHEVAAVLGDELGALVTGRADAAADLPQRAGWDPAARTLRVRFGDGVEVDVVVQVNESVPPGRSVVVRPPVAETPHGWRQVEPAGVVLSPHLPADAAARPGHVREALDGAWRALHAEVRDRLGTPHPTGGPHATDVPPPPGRPHPAEAPHPAGGLRAVEDPAPGPAARAAVPAYQRGGAEPPTPAPPSPDTVRAALTGRGVPEQVTGWARDHLAQPGADGAPRPRPVGEITATVDRYGDAAATRLAGEPVVTAAAVPGTDFHAHARPGADPGTVHALARAALDEAAPTLRGLRVDLAVVPADRLPDGAVARSVPVDAAGRDLPDGAAAPAGGGWRVEVSDRASDLAVPRAVAHEVAELGALRDRAAAGPDPAAADLLRPGEAAGTPTRHDLSPHDVGRIAERGHLTRLAEDPQHAAYARAELDALDRHLGLHPDDPGSAARQRAVDQHLEAARRLPVDVVRRDLADHVGATSPPLADVVARLYADHEAHPLNLTERLGRPEQADQATRTVQELAARHALRHFRGNLAKFLAAHPGEGPLFDPVPDHVNRTAEGGSRKQEYVESAKELDPARRVGPDPTPAERALVDRYAAELRRVLPLVEAEVGAAARDAAARLGTQVEVSGRAKDGDGLVDKVVRMTTGGDGNPGRPHYRVGDVIDAMGTRITVPDMKTLAAVYGEIRARFGVGDGGRILEIENMYAQPKARAPEYRVIPMIVRIEAEGVPYTYELQLTTVRASIAADINHNTVYKPYVSPDRAGVNAVTVAMKEAAALDQLETLGETPESFDTRMTGEREAKQAATLAQALEAHGLTGDAMFEGLNPQTVQKVGASLANVPGGMRPSVLTGMVEWARSTCENDPRDFANRMEYARARWAAAGAEYTQSLGGEVSPRQAKRAGHEFANQEIEAAGVAPWLNDRLTGDLAVVVHASASGEVPHWESHRAELYHAFKHHGELHPSELDPSDPVGAYRRSLQQTLSEGQVVFEERSGDSLMRVIQRIQAGTTVEAIVYVRPDGSTTVATYGSPKAAW